MGGIEVETLGRHLSQTQGLLRDRSANGMALAEEGVQRAAEAVIVEFVRGDVEQEIGSGFLGPGGDVDQGRGLAQALRRRGRRVHGRQQVRSHQRVLKPGLAP